MRSLRAALARPAQAVAGALAVAFALVSYVYLTLPDVRALTAKNPTPTAFMRMREREAEAKGVKPKLVHRWVPYSRISPNLRNAVLVAEDSAFWDHEGIDVEQIRRSISDSFSRGRVPRGASTITQQLAKNLYLTPSYDPLRKIKELIIARRLEVALSKVRILEMYLNVIEWGDRVWGAEAAARTHFATSAASLSRQQAALLAGAIVSPRLLNPARPSRWLLRRQQIVLARMGTVVPTAPIYAEKPGDEPLPGQDVPQMPRFPLTLDEEAGQEGDEEGVPPESEPDTSSGTPPA